MSEDLYLNGTRVAEFWLTIKTALAGKVDTATLEDYTTTDAVATAIATALTDYAQDSDVTTAITTALADYMTTSEVNDAITSALTSATGITYQKVDSLPETGLDKVIYFVPNGEEGSNIYNEYMWIDGKYESIGNTAANFDNVWTKDELRAMTKDELTAILV